MSIVIEPNLFVTLSKYLSENSDKYKTLSYQLQHDNRVGLFSPVGGG